MPLQRYKFSQRLELNNSGGFLDIDDVAEMVRSLIRECSPSTKACHSLVPDSALDAVCELVGLRRDQIDE